MSFPSLSLWFSVLLTAAATIGSVDANSYETIQGRSCFRSMGGMMDSMFYLQEDNPDLVTISDIGDSYLKQYEGRPFGKYDIPKGGYDIYALKITASDSPRKSKDKGKMLVTSGVHAREWATPELLGRFIELLVDGYDKDADITWILQHVEVHAILYVNPDGRFMAEKYPQLYWRKNMNPNGGCGDDKYGVDINRNFDFRWSDPAGASSNPCDSNYHGNGPESEPETQALADYARSLFPKGQRKNNPEKQMDDPFGEEITGMYIDIHSSGGYVYYPWGHKDAKSPDDEALQALGRKINSFNDYKLWAGSQPDFVYEASGDTSDWFYADMGVASLGLEIGDEFYQNCRSFEEEVVPINLPALVYAAKIAGKPFKQVKGPDVLDLKVSYGKGNIKVTAESSDSKMVDSIKGFPDFRTGDQNIERVEVYLDVHPDDYKQGRDTSWAMRPLARRLDSEDATVRTTSLKCSDFTKKKKCKRGAGVGGKGKCAWVTQTKTCKLAKNVGSNEDDNEDSTGDSAGDFEFNSGEETVQLMIDTSRIFPGRHTIFVQATDSDGYRGPVSSAFVDVSKRQRESSLRGTRHERRRMDPSF
ncbi:hypothetical protein ACHAXR_004261 [Thalassiosira sp. AJA248-18]